MDKVQNIYDGLLFLCIWMIMIGKYQVIIEIPYNIEIIMLLNLHVILNFMTCNQALRFQRFGMWNEMCVCFF